jgi:ATP-dependent helicase/nuclease subunit B
MTDGPRTIHAAAGRPAAEALAVAVAAAKGDDPLAPVTVLVPSAPAGLSLRRLLGSGAVTAPGTRPGVCNVRFLPADRVSELIGAPSLAAEGRRPLTAAARAEAVRVTLLADPGVFAAVADHPSTERLLDRTFAELRAASPATLQRLAGQGRRAADIVRLHHATRERLAARHYDEHDQLERAVAIVSGARADHGALGDLGALVVHAPRPDDLTARRLAEAFGDRAVVVEAVPDPTPNADRVISASDAEDEVRAVVRQVVRLARAGTPLHRIAVAHPGAGYPRLVHQAFDAAGIVHNGAGVRTLAGTVAGTALLGALALPDQDFRRDAVTGWLATAPVLEPATGRPVPGARWDTLSRRAGVLGGAEHWDDRLGRLEAELTDQLDEARAIGDDDDAERHERDLELTERLRRFVSDLVTDLGDGERRSWAAHARWARDLLERHLGRDRERRRWPDRDQAAWDQVQAVLDGLAGLDELGAPPDLATFRRAVERDLARPAERLGPFGDGVLVTAIESLRALDLDAVVVTGLAEGLWPGRPHDHPLVPDGERQAAGAELERRDRVAEQHDALLHALASATGERILTVPRADLAAGRELIASRWAADAVSAAVGHRVPAGKLTSAATAGAVTVVGSFVAGVAGPDPGSLLDHDLGRLHRWSAAGGDPLDHPLAVARPRLGAGWATMAARATGGFGPHEGLVEAAAIPDIGSGRPLSPTALETYAQCPRRYFLKQVLRVRATERPEDIDRISPAERGTLVHQILEDYVLERIDGAAPSVDRLLDLARVRFAEIEARGRTGRSLRWQYDQRIIERELATFVVRDQLTPVAAELAFGVGDETPVSIDLPSGRRLAFKGKADRVDVDPGSGDLVVTDYKTGGIGDFDKLEQTVVARGTKLQLPIYGLAAAERFGRPGQPVRSRYWFTSEKGRFTDVGYVLDADRLDLFRRVLDVIVAGIDGGRFPARPGELTHWPDTGTFTNCRWCDYHPVCPADRGRAWERVRRHPLLADYVDLAEGDDPALTGEAAS